MPPGAILWLCASAGPPPHPQVAGHDGTLLSRASAFASWPPFGVQTLPGATTASGPRSALVELVAS
eukprot:3269025-Alexandrium_andersonii.AAC.1